jgi:hypothetical protein
MKGIMLPGSAPYHMGAERHHQDAPIAAINSSTKHKTTINGMLFSFLLQIFWTTTHVPALHRSDLRRNGGFISEEAIGNEVGVSRETVSRWKFVPAKRGAEAVPDDVARLDEHVGDRRCDDILLLLVTMR